jgi:protein O-GlcNAc transferase
MRPTTSSPSAALAQAQALLQAGQPAAAAALCQPLLAQHPDDAPLHATAGLAAAQQGQWPAALACLQRAAELAPTQAGHWLNLGNVQQQLRQWAAAQASFERAAALTPAAPEPHFNLGNLHRAAGQPGPAVAAYRAALQRRPDWWAAREHLAGQLAAQGLHAEAVAEADALLQARPEHAGSWALRGAWLQRLGRPDEALASLTQALRLRPQDEGLAAAVCQQRQRLCDWQAWPDEHTPPAPAALSPLAALALPLGAARTLAAAQRASAALQPAHPTATVWPQPRAAAPLRIAYVSGDLRNHAIGQLVAGVLEAHDRTRFEVHAIAWQQREPDAMARRIAQALGPHWHPVDGLDDAAVVSLARRLQLDVAVDLAGHTAGHRLGLFARRLAPVQLSWLGLPNSTGAPFIDYLVADAVVLPPALRHGASEALIRLRCFQPNDHSRPVPAAAAAPAREAGVTVVYACFNQALKITPAVFSAWMQILQRVPGAQLWLLAEHPAQVANLQREARARGVDPARQLRLWPRASYADHLARYRAVDVVLDTSPFNGGTTTADALSLDCPVLTCPGDTLASRMAASLLTHSGLPEGICADLAACVQQAIAWADPAVRQPLRARLQAARSAPGGLFDAATCTRELEAALQQAVARQRAGLPPADIDAASA